MKQHITGAQFKELSIKARKELMEFWDKHYQQEEECIEIYHYPHMSIGMMIEFLGSEIKDIDPYPRTFSRDKINHWIVYLERKSYEADELCDALWEAVKEILEK
jgi:hypothetical protein